MDNIQIRNYQPGDFRQLCTIFVEAVMMIASQHYSPQQAAAWARIDKSHWKEKLTKSQVRIAIINAQPADFISHTERHINILSVNPEYTCRGVASALLEPLIRSKSEFTVDTSIAAKPFFGRYGFQIVKQQHVEYRGAWFTNFCMRYKPRH